MNLCCKLRFVTTTLHCIWYSTTKNKALQILIYDKFLISQNTFCNNMCTSQNLKYKEWICVANANLRQPLFVVFCIPQQKVKPYKSLCAINYWPHILVSPTSSWALHITINKITNVSQITSCNKYMCLSKS
jgi:hypothetical protein